MTTAIQPLTKRNARKSLASHSKEIKKLHLRKLFAQDAKRGERFTAEAAGLFLDYSKNHQGTRLLKKANACYCDGSWKAADFG